LRRRYRRTVDLKGVQYTRKSRRDHTPSPAAGAQSRGSVAGSGAECTPGRGWATSL